MSDTYGGTGVAPACPAGMAGGIGPARLAGQAGPGLTGQAARGDRRRWLILAVIGLAQLMVVLDLSWRYTLYVNVLLAVVAVTGGMVLLRRHQPSAGQRLDVPGVVLASASMFCVVYGFSNAASHSWRTPSTWGFLAAGGVLLVLFALWQGRAASPLLPPRVALDRNRGGAYLSVFISGAGLFGVFLFLTYYLQQTLGFSPVRTGLGFLPLSVMLIATANLSTGVLMPRIGPKPLVTAGMVLAAGGVAWLTRIGVHSSYLHAVLGPELVAGAGLGFVIAPALNAGTFGVARSDAGIASATVNTGQQIGGSIGTSLLNTVAAGATASYLAAHAGPATAPGGRPGPALAGQALVHGYTTVFWWATVIFAVGAVIAVILFRRGPLAARPAVQSSAQVADQPTAGPDAERVPAHARGRWTVSPGA